MQLNNKLTDIFPRQLDSRKKALHKLGLKTVEDLLYYFPVRYGDTTELKYIRDLEVGDKPIIYAQIKSIKSGKTHIQKTTMTEAVLEDATGTIQAVWFKQPYIAKILQEGSFAKFQGTVSERNGKLYIANPEHQHIDKIPLGTSDSLFGESQTEHFIYPVYPESKGVSSKWIYHSLNKIFSSGLLEKLEDPIPEEILKKYNLPSLKTALIWVHMPKKESDALAARKRFAFEEIFFIQLLRQKQKAEYQKNPFFKIKKTKEEIAKFIERFPFKPTKAQEKSINQILKDFGGSFAMSRLLEGDVGSGKTLVAATTAFAVATSKPNEQDFGNLQVAYMAPTEILATQLFESFIEYFSHLPINIGLITSNGCKKFPSKTNSDKWTNISRTQLLKWVANGEVPILIGTHSLIQKKVKFKHLAYAIIDEQHRFGTNQRSALIRRQTQESAFVPHLLSMSATPIPRTLALTIYGDLDLTLLDQMPTGRKPIITEIITPDKREKNYEFIKTELEAGRQLYVICPRIDEPDPDKARALNVKSVKAEAQRLKREVFQDYEIDVLHSKMTPSDKEETMKQFAEGKIDILVATSVVEVGVNVPNATMIIIEGAERFGLAQLHQLRGRVIRSNHQAYCFVYSDTKTKQTLERLKALKSAKNGFELAEFDLNLRGAGELVGKKQWGISDLGMEAIKNIKMVEAARAEAQELIKTDFDLGDYPLIKSRLRGKEVHFE